MTISTLDQYMAASKQNALFTKLSFTVAGSSAIHSTFAASGSPGSGSLSIGNTTTGIVPTDSTAGFPKINDFAVGATGYLTRVQFSNSVASLFSIYDRLWHAGSVSLTSLATTTFSSQPSYVGRLPNGKYNDLQIMLEINAAVSASAVTVTVTYTNQDGTTGRSTGSSGSLASLGSARIVLLPLQSGDKGVQKIESVIVGGTVATTGSFNAMVVRPLWTGRVPVVGGGDIHGFDKTGMPIIYDSSALFVTSASDTTTNGNFSLLMEIASA